MDDKYLPSLDERKETLFAQISECKRMIYRNMVENLAFVRKQDEEKQLEVNTNNNILAKKIDDILTEWDKTSEESLEDYENRRRIALSRNPLNQG